MFMKPGTESSSRVLFLIRSCLHRYNNIRFHLTYRASSIFCQLAPPGPLDAEITHVSNQEACPPGKLHCRGRGRPDPYDKPDAPLREIRGGGAQSLEQKLVMPQAGFRIGRCKNEENNKSNIQFIGPAGSIFQRMVVQSPLGLLHPVEYKIAFGRSMSRGEEPDSFRFDYI
jgi:hypothetical protein